MDFYRVWMGLALACVVACAAWKARTLDGTGAIAAAVVGTAAAAAGWSWALLLIVYFVSAVSLTRFRRADKVARMGDRVDKSGPRDAAQVLANGGVFAAVALLYAARPEPAWQAVAIGALSASAADTWATEIGSLARARPRSIITRAEVPVGTSGGVTYQGLLAGVAGAVFVASAALVLDWRGMAAIAAIVGGLVGCLFDSVIGAAVQARRWCASCDMLTEQRVHRCGATTSVVGGVSWLDNDGVNLLTTVAGALTAALVTLNR